MNEIHALSGAYAVDALDDIERARFEQHLSDCAECRAEVASLRAAGSLLSETVPATPPAAVRARVLADIRSVRPLPPVTAPAPAVARTRRRFPNLLAAAVTAAVLAGGVVAVHPWTDDQGTQQVSLADQVLNAKDAAKHQLDMPEGSATLVTSASLGRVVMTTDGMADPPIGASYELWLQGTDGVMKPAGLIHSGHAQKILLKGDVKDAVAAGVTIEPSRGSAKPTSDPIALVGFRKSA